MWSGNWARRGCTFYHLAPLTTTRAVLVGFRSFAPILAPAQTHSSSARPHLKASPSALSYFSVMLLLCAISECSRAVLESICVGSCGLFPSLLVISFAVLLSGHLVTLGGVLVMFGRFVVSVLGHANISLIELQPFLDAVAAS